MKKYDKIWLGIIIGTLLPIIILFAVLYVRYSHSAQLQSLGFRYMIYFVPKILSVCLCANLLPFYLFQKTDRMRAQKGVLIATFTLAFIVFIAIIF